MVNFILGLAIRLVGLIVRFFIKLFGWLVMGIVMLIKYIASFFRSRKQSRSAEGQGCELEFSWNGIIVDGILYRAGYSCSALDDLGVITISGQDMERLPASIPGLDIDSNIQGIRIAPGHPYFNSALNAMNEAIAQFNQTF